MKRLLFICLLFLIIPQTILATRGISVKPIAPTGEEVSGNNWLFVIGIDTYIDWPRLKTAVNDAKAVKKVLLDRYYFDNDHLVELYDEEATRANILDRLRYLAKNVNRNDSLVIFYAGHGYLDPITKKGSWIPVESSTNDVSAWISNHDIKDYLRIDAIKAKHVLLISDSCFAGDFFRGQRGKTPKVTDETVKRAYKLTSRQAITSGGLEPVSDAGFGNNSVFSHFLIQTLNENNKPFLVPSDFFRDIKVGVSENAEQFPQFGTLKDVGGQQGGELVLFLKQDLRLKNLSAEADARIKELEYLKRLEAEENAILQKEKAEIALYENKLATVDAEIVAMKKRLGTPEAQSNDNLDTMLSMVEQREDQNRKLEKLRKAKEADQIKRQNNLRLLKARNASELKVKVEADIEKYEKIIASPFGKDMNEAAWMELVSRYPEALYLAVGDIKGLKERLNILDTKKISLINFNSLMSKLNVRNEKDKRIKEINNIVESLMANVFDHMFAKSNSILYSDGYLDVTDIIYRKYVNNEADYLSDKEIVYFPLTRNDQIAFVNLQGIIQESKDLQSIKKLLDEKSKILQEKLIEDKETIEYVRSNIEEKSSSWSNNYKKKQLRFLNDLIENYNNMTEENTLKLKRLESEYMESKVKDIHKIISQIAISENYALIIDSNAKLLPYNKMRDISKIVAKKLDSQ